jgi:hypothetical protein
MDGLRYETNTHQQPFFSNNNKKWKTLKPSGLVPDWDKTPAVLGPDPALKTSAKVAKKASSNAAGKAPSKAATKVLSKAAKKAPVKATTKASKVLTKYASMETLEVPDSEAESLDEFGGLPEEVDQTRNRVAAHSQVNAVQSRRTSQVGVV